MFMENSKNYILSISQKIKQYRREQYLSQKQLGEILGLSAQAISKWENETAYPDLFVLPKLAELLGCQVDDFFRVP